MKYCTPKRYFNNFVGHLNQILNFRQLQMPIRDSLSLYTKISILTEYNFNYAQPDKLSFNKKNQSTNPFHRSAVTLSVLTSAIPNPLTLTIPSSNPTDKSVPNEVLKQNVPP